MVAKKACGSEKELATEVRRAAGEISARIANLPVPVSDGHVLDAMLEQDCGGDVLCAAFWMMDNEPSRFADHQTWHPRLRSLRNNPDVGEIMFAAFR